VAVCPSLMRIFGAALGHGRIHRLGVVEVGEVDAVATVVLVERDQRHEALAPANLGRQVRRFHLTRRRYTGIQRDPKKQVPAKL